MDLEVSALAAQVMPYVSAAVGAYGAGVLAKAQDVASDTTVGWGRRMLQLMMSRGRSHAIEGAIVDLAGDPNDEDALAALRLQIRKLLAADEALATEVAEMAKSAHTRITASGSRSISAQTISGVAVTGDNATITR
ncbi:hypothetical protein [Micromonospora chalcea]|uniref:hypothetical protein n=1 Tax=Micromonospora chalcea TaxID=1874 RepID=UPI0033E03A63